MEAKTKTFDCVEMKRQCQKKLRDEYEARKEEFDSYMDFIRKTSAESEWVQQMRKKFGRQK